MTFSLFLSDSICCFISSRLFSEAGPFFRPFLLLPPPSLEPVLSRKIRQIKPPPISNFKRVKRQIMTSKVVSSSAPIHNTSFSMQLTNGPNKVVLHYTRLEWLAREKYSSLFGPFVSYEGKKSFKYGL
jgi:hypothetical protein